MTTLHNFDPTATPEMEQLLALVNRRMALSPEEAARSQPDFERALREHTLALERRVKCFSHGCVTTCAGPQSSCPAGEFCVQGIRICLPLPHTCSKEDDCCGFRPPPITHSD